MQNTSVNVYSSEAVMFSKQKSRNSENSHRRLTHRCPTPLPGKRNQTFQHVKSSANRETQPHFVHVSEPARTQEYNVDTIREEIKSYLASALHLFEQLPSGPQGILVPSLTNPSPTTPTPWVLKSLNVQPHSYHVFRLKSRLLLRPRHLRIRHENSTLPWGLVQTVFPFWC